ncbi:hypothetical protein [Streptomyces marispadix]|uniref:Uncharacterized protein n=1 Tax=Streptomyces marispadix TaxID=2922868 RepID=A0ABS9SVH6_9ACTN|nr:hypothetical protein [Streptomyces marispadix]MCH6160056.1 hypothetical protein [Streptomyces marispadix]
MTACAPESATAGRTARHSTFTIAADGAYAARLNASAEDGWFPERWTLDGPEPYAVPLPGARPEQSDSQVLPLTDGRVLIARREDGAHKLALLYPTGPTTGELPLGAVESERLTLLPPAPCGRRAYALTAGEHSTRVWLVAGGGDGLPQPVAEVPGRCGGGAWLDRDGRLLAVDRTDTGGTGRTKTVAVDLSRGGEVSPLLQITDESDDRLMLADADSGLLIVRSDAPGEFRLGWGVLGSHRPVRFPESLHPEDALLTPFAVQPGQMLLPESCAVALHGQTTGARAGGAWLGVWRPMQRELRRFRAPGGWLPGKGVWTREGELRLPCATAHAPCGLARLRMRGRSADADAGATVTGTGTGESLGAGVDLSAVVGDAAGPEARRGTPEVAREVPDDGSDADSRGPVAEGVGAERAQREAEGAPTGGAGGAGAGAVAGTATGTGTGAGSGTGIGEQGQEGAVPGGLVNGTAERPVPSAVHPGALPAEVPVAPVRERALRLPMPNTAAGGAGSQRQGAEAMGAGPPEAQGPPVNAAGAGARAAASTRTATGTGTATDAVNAVSPAGVGAPDGRLTGTEPSSPFAAQPAGGESAEPCVRRKPVPLQDAPLATALHDAAVRARTA